MFQSLPPLRIGLAKPVAALLLTAAVLCVAPRTADASPVQITNWNLSRVDNGNYQAAATNPVDGTGLVASYYANAGGGSWVAIPLDATGVASGPQVVLQSSGVTVYNNPAVEYDPVSGGWVVCLGNTSTFKIECFFLDPDATIKPGSPFDISPIGNWTAYFSSSIVYSPESGRWMAAFAAYAGFGPDYNHATNWFDSDGNIGPGNPIILSDSTGGFELAYSPKDDTYLGVYRGKLGTDTAYGGYVVLLDADGATISGPTRVGAGDVDYKNPTIAYNAARDEFLVANFVSSGPDSGTISTQRYAASDGSPVEVEKRTAITGDVTFTSARQRLVVAAPTYGDRYRAITSLTPNGGGSGPYTFDIDGTGTPASAVAVWDPSQHPGEVASPRPRITFSEATCSYLSTFSSSVGGPSRTYELFSDLAAAPTPCRFDLAVTTTGSGAGRVSSTPVGVECGTACAASFDAGTSVTLSAAAAAGSEFSGWSGACSGTATCTVIMSEARTVTASFDAVVDPPAPSVLEPDSALTPRFTG